MSRIPQITAKPARKACEFCGYWFNVAPAKRKQFARRASALTSLRESIKPRVSTDRRSDDAGSRLTLFSLQSTSPRRKDSSRRAPPGKGDYEDEQGAINSQMGGRRFSL